MFDTQLQTQKADFQENVTASAVFSEKHSGAFVMQQYMGVNAIMFASSFPNQSTPPIWLGIYDRNCATNTKPVC